MSTKNDDLEAVRTLIEALKGFDSADQERIIRWAREKLGLPQTSAGSVVPLAPAALAEGSVLAPPHRGGAQDQDIKSFIASKNPQTDNHFTAAVAYYYRFVTQGKQHKDAITADDLQEATRMVNRDRFKRPDQTLVNAHKSGLLDKADRGAYSINTVGENLVAMALPSGTNTRTAKPKTKKSRARTKIQTRKARIG